MGYDLHGTWHAANADGTFETLNLRHEGEDFSDLGRSPELFSMFGLTRPDVAIAPLPQVDAPAALNIRRWPTAPAQGCVTLSALEAYDYEAEAWQEEKFYLGAGHCPVSLSTRYLRETVLPGVRRLAQGREVFFTYVVG